MADLDKRMSQSNASTEVDDKQETASVQMNILKEADVTTLLPKTLDHDPI